MKNIITLVCLFVSCALSAQIDGPHQQAFALPPQTQCLTDAQRQQILTDLEISRATLEQQGILLEKSALRGVPHPLFQWPVTKNPTTPYNHVWSISNHVDHNASFPNAVQDYNCGNRTYDTDDGYNHQGIDIFTWPFSWYMFQNNHAWAVAAAPGIILAKYNGNFDMNCSFNGGNWNAVYIQHADGSVAWYGHLKNGSLTTKTVGQSVATGEYLGVIGSSGNSTGPHLHFEVYNNAGQLVDTYTGACNNWSSASDSWWANQKPYVDPKINAVFTHSAPPVFNDCPATETTNFKDNFALGETVFATVYLADQFIGSNLQVQLRRPDNSLAYSDGFNAEESYYASYWWWSFSQQTINQNGLWTVSFSFGGNTVNKAFSVGTLATDDFSDTEFRIFPNPANDRIYFSLPVQSLEVFDLTGKKLSVDFSAQQADVTALPAGIYLFKGMTVDGHRFTHKVAK